MPLSTVQREISQLERAGIVGSQRVGPTRLVYANPDSPFFEELQSLILKAFGPATIVERLFRRIPRIDEAYIFGSWAARYLGEAGPPPRDLDVVAVGNPNVNAVYRAGRMAESELGIEVNPLVVTQDEWEHPAGIITRIKSGPLVPISLQ